MPILLDRWRDRAVPIHVQPAGPQPEPDRQWRRRGQAAPGFDRRGTGNAYSRGPVGRFRRLATAANNWQSWRELQGYRARLPRPAAPDPGRPAFRPAYPGQT